MTQLSRRDVELLNKRLNNRMRKLEKEGMTTGRDYVELKKLAEKSGATKTKSGLIRFKENLKTVEKKGNLAESERFSKLASFYGGTKKQEKLKEIKERMQSKGKASALSSPEALSDILEAQKSTKGQDSLWTRLSDYFDSDQIVEIFSEKIVSHSISQRLDWIENAFAGVMFDEGIAMDFLKGFIGEKEVLHFIATGSRNFDELKE